MIYQQPTGQYNVPMVCALHDYKTSQYLAKGTSWHVPPIEHTDQPAHPRSLIRIFERRSMGSQGSNVSSVGKLRLRSDCANAQTDSNLRCTRMPTCT